MNDSKQEVVGVCPHDCPWSADGPDHCGWCPECSPEVPEWTL